MKLEERVYEFESKLQNQALLYADTIAFAEANKGDIEKFTKHTIIDDEDVSYLMWLGVEDGSVLLKDAKFAKTPLLSTLNSADDTRTSLHRHDYIELGYVFRGCFKQCIVDKVYEFNEGDFFLIDTNTQHYDLLKGTNNFVIFVILSQGFFDAIFLSNLREGPLKKIIMSVIHGQKSSRQFVQFRPHDNIRLVNEIIEQLLNELDNKMNGWKYIVRGLVSRLMTILSFSYRNQLSRFDQIQFNTMLFDEICVYINEHYRTITIEDLINQYHYNADYYNRLIKKNTGLTYSKYVQKVRIEKAKELMIQTNNSIEQIIHYVGYKTNGFFYKIFYKHEGRTPQEYRKKYSSNK